jgi:hypothetical protein
MAGMNVPVVLIPRYTTFLGPQGFPGEAIPVSPYERVSVTYWQGPYIGVGTAVVLVFQQSNDGVTWSDCPGGPWTPPAMPPGELPFTAGLSMAWMRLTVLLTGTGSGFTCWVRGFFEKRER